LTVKGKGTALALPLPLADTSAITVQLVSGPPGTNQCWQAVLDAADATNTATEFKDKQ
jgi:hypothetical protein